MTVSLRGGRITAADECWMTQPRSRKAVPGQQRGLHSTSTDCLGLYVGGERQRYSKGTVWLNGGTLEETLIYILVLSTLQPNCVLVTRTPHRVLESLNTKGCTWGRSYHRNTQPTERRSCIRWFSVESTSWGQARDEPRTKWDVSRGKT